MHSDQAQPEESGSTKPCGLTLKMFILEFPNDIVNPLCVEPMALYG